MKEIFLHHFVQITEKSNIRMKTRREKKTISGKANKTK